MLEEDIEEIRSGKGLEFISDPYLKDARSLQRSMMLYIFLFYVPLLAWLVILLFSIISEKLIINMYLFILFGIISIGMFFVMLFTFPIFNVNRSGIGTVDSIIIKDEDLIIKKGVMRDRWVKVRVPLKEIKGVDYNVESFYRSERERVPWIKRWITQRFSWKPKGAYNWYWLRSMRDKYSLVLNLETPLTLKEPILYPFPPSFKVKKTELSEIVVAVRPEDRPRFVSVLKGIISDKKFDDGLTDTKETVSKKKQDIDDDSTRIINAKIDKDSKKIVIKKIFLYPSVVLLTGVVISLAGSFLKIDLYFGYIIMMVAILYFFILMASNIFNLIGRVHSSYKVFKRGFRFKPMPWMDIIIKYDQIIALEPVPKNFSKQVMGFLYQTKKGNSFIYPTRFTKNLFYIKLLTPAKVIATGRGSTMRFHYTSFILGDDGVGTLQDILRERMK